MLSRRDFVKGGVAFVSIGTTSASLLKGAVAFAAQDRSGVDAGGLGKILIVVQLAGGNDGLATLVPIGDSAYRSARPALAPADESLLPVDDGYGLAQELGGLKGLWDEQKLAIVRGVGYPGEDYSHFRSMAIWEHGDPSLALDHGWLGRTLDAMESEQHDPFFGFNVGGTTPPEMRGERIAIPSVSDQSDYGFRVGGQPAREGDARTATLLKLYEEYPATSPYGVLLETTAETAVESSRALAAVAASYTPAVPYPETSFGAGLSLLAQAITGGLGVRVGHITLGGFDTHNNQLAEHSALLTTLDEGLTAFYRDLAAHGRSGDVLVMTWSEFGRRVAQNGNDGTDHGASSIMFMLGDGVKRGLYGDAPSLTNLVDRGNLAYTTDFRSVYATLIERWLGTPSAPLMGQQWPLLNFL